MGSAAAMSAYGKINDMSHDLVTLSTQHITSCTPNPLHCGGTGGCMGSIEPLAFTYASMFGIVTEEEYPYTSGDPTSNDDQVCDFDATKTDVSLIIDTDSSWESLAREALEASTEKILSQAERAMASKVHKNHQILQQVRDQLARCLVEKGDYNGAEKILRSTLATTCLRYGETSVEYSNELLKFTDVLEAKLSSDLKVDTKELVKLLVKARNIFKMQYGDSFSQVQEIQEKLDFFQQIGFAKEA